jgi:hypothetical protein
MEAAHPDLYTLELPLITLERAYEVASRGICQPFDTLIAGWVYDIVDACQRHHDIFVVLRQNYPTQYTVIQLPQRCHDDFVKFLDFIDTYHIESGVHFTYTGNTSTGKRIFVVEGGVFSQSLIE